MRELSFDRPRDDRPQPTGHDWLNELRDILFQGTGTSESRLEAFLDRMERRQ
jgi:hypothetical protein